MHDIKAADANAMTEGGGDIFFFDRKTALSVSRCDKNHGLNFG